MAQKKKPAVDPVRAKAAQMRQAQERADRRTRIIVISAVAVIVLAVVAAVGGVIWKQQAQVNAAHNVDASQVLGAYADGRPIIVNANGVVAEADPNLPTLTEYFDYSCHACADLDVYMGADLTNWAAQGHYNIEIQPVITVNMDYLKPAASASLVVAQKAPDKWVDFHHALLAYFRSQFQASNGTVVQNLDASWKQVKVIAAEVGGSLRLTSGPARTRSRRTNRSRRTPPERLTLLRRSKPRNRLPFPNHRKPASPRTTAGNFGTPASHCPAETCKNPARSSGSKSA